MKRLLAALAALSISASASFAASTINSLPPVPFPLVDPGNPLGAIENLWITTGNNPGSDWRITPTQLGYIFQGAVAPTAPFRYEYWWNTGTNPPQLEVYDGSQWVIVGTLNTTTHVFAIDNSSIAPGPYPNITGVGTLTTGVWNATVIQPLYGGTGIANNNANTVTLAGPVSTAGALTTAGAFPLTLTTTASTNSTLPAGSHSLAPLDSPAFTTPDIGVAIGTSLALGGGTIGSNAFAVTGTSSLTGDVTLSGELIGDGGPFNYWLDGVGLNASTAGIRMPKSNAGGICSGTSGTIINYGAANGAPVGGSYSYWDCAVGGGTFGWVDAGVAVGLLSNDGLTIVPVAAQNGFSAVPQSGTGAGGFTLTGAWNAGLDLSAATVTTAINLGTASTKILYDSSNYTDLTGSAGSGVFRIHAGGNLAASFAATLAQLGSTVPQHLGSGQTTPPSLSACGTSPDDTGATDTAGTVTMGTGTPTGCVITFNTAYIGTPNCTVVWQGDPLGSQHYTVSNTAITLTQTATSSNKVNYVCVAPAGG